MIVLEAPVCKNQAYALLFKMKLHFSQYFIFVGWRFSEHDCANRTRSQLQ